MLRFKYDSVFFFYSAVQDNHEMGINIDLTITAGLFLRVLILLRLFFSPPLSSPLVSSPLLPSR